MRLDEQPYVGSAEARALHGHSAGGDAVLLGGKPSESLRESLEVFGLALHGPIGHGGPDPWLGQVAEIAAAGSDRALVLVASDVEASPVALLDLVDSPADPTATATLERAAVDGDPDGLTVVRTQAEHRAVHSVGTTRHAATDPTAFALGVLRVAGRDRARAAEIWRAAAGSASAADPAVAPFDLALLALVRAGMPVGMAPLGPFSLRRGAAHTRGAQGSAWQQRLRGASRGGDGFFSTMVIRPMSRRLTGFGLAHGWSPNVVTVTSLLLGLLASGLAAVDNRWTWAAAAVLLQAAIVIDCVDGEIARFTRRFSALGAWLDAVGDRIKEYSLLAAVATVGVRRGEDEVWLLAIVAMVLVTIRHMEDYAYIVRTRASTSAITQDVLAVDEPWDLGPADARLEAPMPRRGRAQAVFWLKKVLHMPIAERYLVLSIGLLTFDVQWLFWALIIAVTVALVWTQGGRTAKALLRSDGYLPETSPSPSDWGHLDHQLDLGPLSRAVGRAIRAPIAGAFVGWLLMAAAAVLAWRDSGEWAVVGLVVAGVLLVGAGFRAPLRHPLGWQATALLWAAEALLVLGLTADLPDAQRWVAFAYLAAVAWHRYDVVYRLRDTGTPSPPWLTTAGLGVDGRMVLLAVLWALGAPLSAILPWAALALILLYAGESASGWRRWARGDEDDAAESSVDAEVGG